MHRPLFHIAYLISACLWFAANAHASELEWNLNDVSYLFLIPQGHDQNADFLLNPDDAGRKGVLLPGEFRDHLPTLLLDGSGNSTLFASHAIRVVSVRVDPCPSLIQNACVPEVRMVWQPVQFDRYDAEWTTRDAALHSVYQLSALEFAQLRQGLWQLKVDNHRDGITTHKRPLGVHPALSNQRTARTFNEKFQKLLLDHCGANNLVRVSFMSLMIPTQWWRFGGFERNKKGEWTRLLIPRLGAPDEDLFNVALEAHPDKLSPGAEMDAVFNVLPEEYPETDNIFNLINDSYRGENADDLPVFKNKLNAVARFRNPHKTNFHTLDCASCHYADPARFYAEKTFPALSEHMSVDAYRNPNPGAFNLENTTVGREATRIVRGLGYFGAQPAINQRAINESAEAAHWLNTHR